MIKTSIYSFLTNIQFDTLRWEIDKKWLNIISHRYNRNIFKNLTGELKGKRVSGKLSKRGTGI